jgi:hypothetical protein
MGANDFEPIYYGIKKEAVQKYNKLRDAQEEYKYWNCKDNPYYYMDYDGYGFEDKDGKNNYRALTVDECETLCADCPLLKQWLICWVCLCLYCLCLPSLLFKLFEYTPIETSAYVHDFISLCWTNKTPT